MIPVPPTPSGYASALIGRWTVTDAIGSYRVTLLQVTLSPHIKDISA